MYCLVLEKPLCLVYEPFYLAIRRLFKDFLRIHQGYNMKKQEIDHILTRMLDAHKNVSDLNLTVGKPFQVESDGELISVKMRPDLKELTPFQTEIFALNLINNDRRLTENLLSHGSCDLSYSLPGKARFRVNIFSQSGYHSIVLRKLESKIPTITTSLAAILNEINEKKSVHVVTLEDPVEYQHPHKKSTFNQRELGIDFDTYANGLRAALRQAPKVILVGEMRDRETVEIGLNAAETGHLVLTTLHTIDAGSTINRIIGMFHIEEEHQVRIRLSDSVRWAVSQRLLPKIGGGRVATFEIMGANLRVQDAILNGESEGKTFYKIMQDGTAFGMTTFDSHIIGLYEQGLITRDMAISFSSRKGVVGRGIDLIDSARGKSTTMEKPKVDWNYSRKAR